MTSRRDFIKTVAVIPPGLFFGRGWAANADPSRQALIIGNSAYRDAPLVNPVNDARAFTHLCTQAGLTVDSQLNASRIDMMAAIERFGAAAKRAETRQAVFYYAGHGAQLDWRNYLLPVDAVVEKQEHMKQRCVDLTLLLGQLSAAKDKTFIVILDACRNNPFGRSYRPEQKGLSQFDAPGGSLIAYATAPGNVASDGAGENSLYTENLVRELSQRATRIEDALKRVRLNVRLASRGEQIPWETTSLEGDVFLFNEGQKKLTEAELIKLVETDINEWSRIKTSNKLEDWVGYLRTFPNGRFAEIAQMRLTRLLAESEKPRPSTTSMALKAPSPVQALPATPATSPAQAVAPKPEPAVISAPSPDSPAIDIRAGVAVPMLIVPSANPFSAGRYPLGRIFTLGDEASFRQTDMLTGLVEQTFTMRVTRVDYEGDRVEFNNGDWITDLMGNAIKFWAVQFNPPVQFAPTEFQIGKKWTAAFGRIENGVTSNSYYDLHIVKRETISVPAGSFDTFRIEGEGWNNSFGLRLEYRVWLVPGLNFLIKRESIVRGRSGGFSRTERYELVSLRQHNSIQPV